MTDPALAPPAIYEHATKKEWGRAILLQEFEGKRAFLFDDGTERAFPESHWDKMPRLDVPDPAEAQRIYQEIAKKRPAQSTATKRTRRKKAQPKITFDNQVQIFLSMYPEAFAGEAYAKAVRGSAEAKGKARGIAGPLADAADKLGPDAFDAAPADVHATVLAVLKASNKLLPRIATKAVKDLPEDGLAPFAEQLKNLLYGDGEYAARFDAFVATLPNDLSWPLATLLPALRAPGERFFVKPTFARKQAQILGVDVAYDTKPNAKSYEDFEKVATRTRDLLMDRGHAPADLMDVHAFMADTLAPAAVKAFLEKHAV